MKLKLINLTFIFALCLPLFGKVDGTAGLPIGGIGTGAVKFGASEGTFYASFSAPTRNGDYTRLDQTQFQIYTNRYGTIESDVKINAIQNAGRVDDDAVFPLHWVNFGEWNDVSVEMTAYMPYEPGSVPDMCHPCALFEFSLSNLQNSAVTAAVAFQITTPAIPVEVTGRGFWAAASNLELCLLGEFQEQPGDLSYGNDAGFFTTGQCNNQLSGDTNRLTMRLILQAQESRSLRFVLSWYRPDEKEHYQYTNLWQNAREAAISALDHFDIFKNNSQELVTRMRASNLPAWLVDQTLNSTVNLVNNSVYFQDGRYCNTEGQWTPEGTMDQMWHARQIYAMINPELVWMELEWWARTQHVQSYTGQIHHDFGTNFNYVDWDDTEHDDYRPIDEWVDLNCGFIISIYEAFEATADLDKLAYFWPYAKKAVQRILDQVDEFGDTQYPFTFSTSKSTYDAGGNSQAYNTNLSVLTYYIMTRLAEIMNDEETASLCEDAFEQAADGFEEKWLNTTYPAGNYCESVLGGPWITNFLKIEPFWEKQKLDNLYWTLVGYYDPLTQGMGKFGGSYSEWQPYLVGHLGGYSIQTGHDDIWMSLQRDMYERNYFNRDLVFNQQLGIPSKVNSPKWIATNPAGTNQYISIPVLWRNYYNLVGFHRNLYTGELWLEPVLFDSLNHQMKNALIIMPEGYAEINYEEYGESYQNQRITFYPDQPMEISSLYVWDLYKDTVNTVKVDGIDTQFTRRGKGDQRHLQLNWAGTISPAGLTIEIEGQATETGGPPSAPQGFHGAAAGPSQILLSWEADSDNANGYYIDCLTGESFQIIGEAARNDTSYLDTGLLQGTEYVYRIRAYNGDGISEAGSEIEITTLEGGQGDIIMALNAGGDSYTSVAGVQYTTDQSSGLVSGGTPYSTSASIENTHDDELYQTERYGDCSYTIPLENGAYDVVLKFAEIYHDAANSRLFDVYIEDEPVIRNLDLYFRAGKNRAYDVVIPVELKDGNLDINFITLLDNAKISAMEIRERMDGIPVDRQSPAIPEHYFISQNYPNPFNPITTISYQLPRSGFVTISIYSETGRLVEKLVREYKNAGYHSVQWNAKNTGSGIYYYRIQCDDFSATRKCTFLK